MNIKHLLKMEAAGILLNAKARRRIAEHRAALVQEDTCTYDDEMPQRDTSITENAIRIGAGFGIGYLIGRNL